MSPGAATAPSLAGHHLHVTAKVMADRRNGHAAAKSLEEAE